MEHILIMQKHFMIFEGKNVTFAIFLRFQSQPIKITNVMYSGFQIEIIKYGDHHGLSLAHLVE